MEKYNTEKPITFTSGMYDLNPEANFNYQLGNAKLALDTIMNWIAETDKKNKEL